MTCKEMLRTQNWLDGELTESESAQIEAHVSACPDCQSLSADIARVSDALRGIKGYSAPAQLREKVLRGLKSEERRPRRNYWLGFASGGGMAMLAAGLAAFLILAPSTLPLSEALVQAHGRALSQGPLVMVRSTDHHTVKPWLAEHAAISPAVTDFSEDGFVLVGGRKDMIGTLTAAVTVYYSGQHEIDLFTWVDNGQQLPEAGISRGFRMAFWKIGDLDYAAVSDVNDDAFQKFVALARQSRE